MATKPFFSRYNANFTMTPNAFFDQIVTQASTLNEVRAVAYVIRKTIGWNRKFEYITRSQFVAEAGISNGQLTKTLESCIKKGWLLCFRTGERGKEENYYFLNDTLNAKLVAGLEQKLFAIEDLNYKSEEGLVQLLRSHGIEYEPDATEKDQEKNIPEEAGQVTLPVENRDQNSENTVCYDQQKNIATDIGLVSLDNGYGDRTGTETVRVRRPYGYGNRTGTDSVEVGVRNPYGYPYGIRRGRGTESVGVDGCQSLVSQGLAAPLNTDLKYNLLNTRDEIQHHHQRSVTEDRMEHWAKKHDDVDVVASLSEHHSQSYEALRDTIFRIAQKLQVPMDDYLVQQLIKAGEGQLDRIVAGMRAAKQFASTKKVENWCGVLIYAVRHGHQPGPEDPTSLALKAKQEKYKDVYQS